MKDEIIKILILEDVESDILILEHHLKKAEFKYITKFSKTKQGYQSLLKSFQPDIILSDYNIPGFSGLQALEEKLKVLPEIPFILVTGFLDEKTAVKIIKKGAWNYILKDNYTRLIPAVESALRLKREKELVIKTGKKLIQSENRFEIIFNKSAEPIIIVDAEQNNIPVIKNVNEAVKKITKKEIIGKPISTLIPHIPEKELIKLMGKVKGGETIKDFVTFKKNELTTLYFNVTASLILFNNEKNILITASDISEKHIAELKLKKQNKTFRKLYKEYITQNEKLQNTIIQHKKTQKELTKKIDIINRSPAVSFLWKNKPGWPVKYVSENVSELSGYSIEDFISNKIKYEQIIHPDDLQGIQNEVQKNSKNKLINNIHKTYRIITKDNVVKWVRDDTIIIRKKGKIIAYEGIVYDVTETVKSQKGLKASETKYRSILEANPDMIVICSKDKKIQYMNPAAVKSLGYKKNGETCYKSLFGFDKPCNWCAHNYVKKYNTVQNEILIPNLNRNFLVSFSKINESNGQTNFLSSYKDITELRQLQNDRLHLLNALEKGLNEMYFINPENFKIIYSNSEPEKKLGLTRETILNRKIYNFQTDQNKNTYKEYYKHLKTKNKEEVFFETFQKNGEGKLYPVSVYLKLINYNNKKTILAFVNDISDKKRKDEQIKLLSTAVHQSPSTVFITDTKGNIEYVNPKFTEITGYDSEEVIGENPRILKSGKQTTEFYEDLWNTISSGKIWTGEFHNKKKNGQLYWEKAIINSVKNTAGKIIHYIAVKEDITEQKKIREQLIKSEEHFRLLFENSLIGMYLTTSDGTILNVNKTLYKILGCNSLEEIKNNKFENLKNISINRTEFKKEISKKGIVIGFENIWYGRNKELIYIRENARKYTDEEGNEFYEGTIEDITLQKTALRKLKEMNSFNEYLIKVGKFGYAIYNNTGKCINANKAYAKILGAELKDILKENFKRNIKWTKYQLVTAAERCLENGIHSKQIITGKSNYNKDIYIEINFNRFYSGTKTMLLVIIKDISSYIKAKRRQIQTESEYINLIENVNVPVFSIDTKGKIKEWNSAIESLSGYKRNEAKKKFIKDIILPTKKDIFSNLLNKAFSGNTLFDEEIILKSKKNELIPLLISSTIQLNEEELSGITCVAQDITEKEKYKKELEKKIEERTHKLIEALKKEKELGDLKSQFVSMTSHEFRTPLSAIKLAAGFIRKYYDKAEKEKILQKTEKIESQIVHMTNLLEDVLTIGKIESGKIKFNPEILNLTEFLYNIIEDVKNATRKTHKINFTHNDSKCLLKSDEKILRNIFINLLRNAIKFSPDANEIFFNLESNDNTVKLQVKDLGIGIKSEELEKIFFPFRRGQNVETIQGTGLGLAIVKESTELLKGIITVKSELGKGTEFTVILPKN